MKVIHNGFQRLPPGFRRLLGPQGFGVVDTQRRVRSRDDVVLGIQQQRFEL